MKFSLDKNLTFEQAKALFFEQLGDWKIMALASSVNDYVMVRNVSCLFYNDKIYFKTDKDFRKTKQLYRKPQCCPLLWRHSGGRDCRKTAGLVVDEPGRVFEGLYKKHLWGSYNKYSHEDSEIIIEVTPKFVEVWDTSEDNYAYQIFIDFDKKEVTVKPYDKK